MAVTTNSSLCQCLREVTYFYEKQRTSPQTLLITDPRIKKVKMLAWIEDFIKLDPAKYNLADTIYKVFYGIVEMKCSFHQHDGIIPTIYIDVKMVSNFIWFLSGCTQNRPAWEIPFLLKLLTLG